MFSSYRSLFLTIAIWLWSTVVIAQSPSPLEITTGDPLLPSIDRPLTSFESYRLEKAIEELDKQAMTELAAGNPEAAFATWYRLLRLERVLDPLREIKALGRVGNIAWENERINDLKIITARLEVIEQELNNSTDVDLSFFQSLGEAYQQIHNLQRAIIVYEELLTKVRILNETQQEKEVLTILGKLYVARFDYLNAATIYEDLLSIAQAESDFLQEGIYLQKLAEIYSEALQPENAIVVKEQLVTTYEKNQQLADLAILKLSLGSDYQALNQVEDANANYQGAYDLAISQQKYGLAAEAKLRIANLYYSVSAYDQALSAYRDLLEVYQNSYDLYGSMNAYDQIGKIYTQQENYEQALKAFQAGLNLAESLNYQQAYFNDQIAKTQERVNNNND